MAAACRIRTCVRRYEHMFYTRRMRAEYREEQCRSALNRVKGMGFGWSLNPYTGCVHRCTFCYVRAFELRADRPADDRYGRSIRVKVNVAEVLSRELARPSWRREQVVIGAATDPYQPAEGRYRLTRACIEALGRARSPFGLITRGPLIVRDIDVLQAAARRTDVSVTFSVPTLDADVWRSTEPGTAPPRQRLRALSLLVEAGLKASVGMAPILPGLGPARTARRGREGGARGRCRRRVGEPAPSQARDEGALPRSARAGLARTARTVRAALQARRLSPTRRDRAGPRSGAAPGPRARGPGPASTAADPSARAGSTQPPRLRAGFGNRLVRRCRKRSPA